MNLRTLSLAVAAPFFWGATLTLAKPVVSHFPPLFFMLVAYGGMALILLCQRNVVVKTKPALVFIIALFSVTVQGSMVFGGLRYLDATTANLLLQFQVPAAVLLGWLINGEQLTRQKFIGVIISLIGVSIVIGLPEKKPPLGSALLLMGGGLTWALGQVLAQKWSKDSGMGILKGNALAGVPQLAVATLLFETGQWQAVKTATATQWLLYAGIVLFGFYAAYVCWFALLKRVPMNVAAPFVLLMTPFGILMAFLVLGETMSPAQMIGGGVLLAGLAIVNGFGLRRFKLWSAA